MDSGRSGDKDSDAVGRGVEEREKGSRIHVVHAMDRGFLRTGWMRLCEHERPP